MCLCVSGILSILSLYGLVEKLRGACGLEWLPPPTHSWVSTSPAPIAAPFISFSSGWSECQLLRNADFAILIAPCWFASKQKHSALSPNAANSLPLSFHQSFFYFRWQRILQNRILPGARMIFSPAPSFAISILAVIITNDDCKNHQRYNMCVPWWN